MSTTTPISDEACPSCGFDQMDYARHERATVMRLAHQDAELDKTKSALQAALSRAERAEKALHEIHGDCGLFRMAINMGDPRPELLERVKMIEEAIQRASRARAIVEPSALPSDGGGS